MAALTATTVHLTVINSTFTNNSAIVSGGGIYSQGSLTVSNSIFTNNSAKNIGGGGIYANNVADGE